jgi:hypothetical protein
MEKLHGILNKKMDRKEFLISLGIILFTITGISGVLKNFKDIDLNGLSKKTSDGYGSSAYGV